MAALDPDRLRQIARAFPEARLIVLFGSVATGRELPWSDADFGVAGVRPIVERCAEGARRRLLAEAGRG